MDLLNDGTSDENETTQLWKDGGEAPSQIRPFTSSVNQEMVPIDGEGLDPILVLPISFLAALGMAATAATSIFAYATLLCEDPRNCEESQQKDYAGSVALSVSIANICSLLALGSLEKLSRRHRKAGLAMWIICRSMSVAVLAIGVYFRSIKIALSGRIFQGLASDNLLHFSLNAIYVRAAAKAQFSRLIGASLALFMVGISISPAIAGLFHDFTMSFLMAGGIFAVCLLYLLYFVRGRNGAKISLRFSQEDTDSQQSVTGNGSTRINVQSLTETIFSPLGPFYSRPTSLLTGLALLIYTAVQSYVFSLILVHTSLVFGFTGKQNGYLLSIVHAVSAIYLFTVLFVVPRMTRQEHMTEGNTRNSVSGSRDSRLALVSMCTHSAALLEFANSSQVWEIYAFSALLALGLATPSFIKSHFLKGFPKRDGAEAVGALAMIETPGSLFSPLIMGAWQVLWPGKGVFYGAAGMMALGTALLGISAFIFNTDMSLNYDDDDE
ncbi:amp-dependent synthetase ligase protein [Rutstroemia sp. NJR-2017a BVV2]|nr:amp-dependent synthetase ligase protein [Rutstroemia sp. NJR-2017a BVV2]